MWGINKIRVYRVLKIHVRTDIKYSKKFQTLLRGRIIWFNSSSCPKQGQSSFCFRTNYEVLPDDYPPPAGTNPFHFTLRLPPCSRYCSLLTVHWPGHHLWLSSVPGIEELSRPGDWSLVNWDIEAIGVVWRIMVSDWWPQQFFWLSPDKRLPQLYQHRQLSKFSVVSRPPGEERGVRTGHY